MYLHKKETAVMESVTARRKKDNTQQVNVLQEYSLPYILTARTVAFCRPRGHIHVTSLSNIPHSTFCCNIPDQ